jgi:hypothetical protein
MMQSVIACFVEICFSGNEKVEKFDGKSSYVLVNPPLKIYVITPAETSVCALKECFIVQMKCKQAFPCEDCLKKSRHVSVAVSAATSLFDDEALGIRFLVGFSSFPKPFLDVESECVARIDALCSSIALAIFQILGDLFVFVVVDNGCLVGGIVNDNDLPMT